MSRRTSDVGSGLYVAYDWAREANVLSDAGNVSRLAVRKPRDRGGAVRGLSQGRLGHAEHLAAVGRRGAVLRLDRRRAPQPRPKSYTIRFTPRRKGSIWSRINVERYAALRDQPRMGYVRIARTLGKEALEKD